MPKYVVMIGMDWHSLGGMTAVVHNYHKGGLWKQWPIRYLATFRHDRLIDKLWMALRAYTLLLIWLLSGKVAVVHAHSAVYASIWRKFGLLMMARLFGAKTIFHLHGGEFVHFYTECCGPIRRWLVQYLLRSVDIVAVLTERWIHILQEVEPRCHPVVIPNPIGIPDLPAQAIPEQILFLGRLRDVKGVFDLVEALGTVVAKYPNVKLILGGDGEQAPILSMAQSLHVEENIQMVGWVDGDRKDQLLRESSIFVLPSHFEAQPVCILEAMAQGVPVLATSVGGVPDMCINGKEAILVEAKKPADLAAALLLLLDDESLRHRLAIAARERVDKDFSYKCVLGQIGQIYSHLGLKPKVAGEHE